MRLGRTLSRFEKDLLGFSGNNFLKSGTREVTCTLRATPVAGYESSCSTTQVRLIQNEDRKRSSFGMKTVYDLLTHYGYVISFDIYLGHHNCISCDNTKALDPQQSTTVHDRATPEF